MFTQDCPSVLGVSRWAGSALAHSPDLMVAASHGEGCPGATRAEDPALVSQRAQAMTALLRSVCFKTKLMELVLAHVITAKYICAGAPC